jgi:hypothetical protein
VQAPTASPEPEPPVPLPASKVLAPAHAAWLPPQTPLPQQTAWLAGQHVPSLHVAVPLGHDAWPGIMVPPELPPLELEPVAPELLEPVLPELAELEVLVAPELLVAPLDVLDIPLDVLDVLEASQAAWVAPHSRSAQHTP